MLAVVNVVVRRLVDEQLVVVLFYSTLAFSWSLTEAESRNKRLN